MKKNYKKMIALALAGALCVGVPISFQVPSSLIGVEAAETQNTGVTEIPGTVKAESELNGSFLSVSGFASNNVNDRSQYSEGMEEYAVITNEYEFFTAIQGAEEGTVKVIELRCDLNLGWNELSDDVKDEFGGSMIEPYQSSQSLEATPVGNPILIETGISCMTIDGVDGLTIFSQTGNTIKHAEIKFNDGANDIVLRNLHFDEVWEWDDWRSSGFGSTGGRGNHKRTGWTFLKLNGCHNVWVDHCSFGISFDGNVDIENGSSGITLSWCEFGDTDYSVGSMLYRTTEYLEELYQESKVNPDVSSFNIYRIMRDNGMTKEQIMQYMGYHDKVHLCGAGDKDTWYTSTGVIDPATGLFGRTVDETKTNANELIRLSLAYNHYTNVGQRVPMIRGGVGHLYNCYVDDMTFAEMAKLVSTDPLGTGSTIRQQVEAINGTMVLTTRGLDARNEASIGADTCVYYGSSEPVVGSEFQNDDPTYMNAPYSDRFFGFNHALVVNSSVQKYGEQEAYFGSSWDNNGSNPFTTQMTWHDHSTIGNWSWGQEGDSLSYSYQTFPLADVVKNTTTYSGYGKLDMGASDWLKTEYSSDFPVKAVEEETSVPIESISLNKQSANIFLDQNEYLQLLEEVTPANTTEEASTYTWTSSNPEVARVNDCGLVTPLTYGSATITVTTAGGKTASCDINVVKSVSGLEVTTPETIYVGDILHLSALVTPADVIDPSVSWDSAGTKIKVLDSASGLIQAVASGKNQMITTANLIGNRVGSATKSVKTTLNVIEPAVPVTGIEMAASSASVEVSQSALLTAQVLPTDATNQTMIWTSADDSIAVVDESGRVSGVALGTTTITATSVNYGFTATCEVTVKEASIVTPPAFIPGDVNNDGIVDLTDAQLVLKAALGIETLPEDAWFAANMNADDTVDLSDAQIVLKRALGIAD